MGSTSVTTTRAPWPAQCLRAALADVAVAAHHRQLAADHHVGCALEAVDEGVAAAVQVVELGLGHRVVHVDGGEEQRPVPLHAVEAVHSRGGLLAGAAHRCRRGPPCRRILVQNAAQRGEHHLLLGAVARAGFRHNTGLLARQPLVQQQRGVPAVVEDQCRSSAVGPAQHLLGAAPVLLERLALPGEHRHAARLARRALRAHRHGCGGVILGGEDVARRPAHLGAEFGERLDENRRLDRHVQRAGDAGTGERLAVAVAGAQCHEARHLVLGELDLLAAEGRQGKICDLEIASRGAHAGAPPARAAFRSAMAEIGPGSTPRSAARCRETKSPNSIKSMTCAIGPSPAARTS